jgi:hypothetical protein
MPPPIAPRLRAVPHRELTLEATSRLITILEDAVFLLKKRAQTPHRFRFVSNAQAVPYSIAYAEWVRSGELGPQPMATTAEMRAAIYDQATSASELSTDNRRVDNGAQVSRLAGLAMKRKPSVDFSGYWQRHVMAKAS